MIGPAGFKSEVATTSRKADTVILHQRTQEHKYILDWLTTVHYGPQQSDYIGRRQPGTGIPGAGKTILTSTVVESLKAQNNRSVGIAYVYCNFQRQEEQTAKDLLASLIKQLTQNLPNFPERVELLYHKHKHELA
ncbi:ankyrin [Ilyonectria robusta]